MFVTMSEPQYMLMLPPRILAHLFLKLTLEPIVQPLQLINEQRLVMKEKDVCSL